MEKLGCLLLLLLLLLVIHVGSVTTATAQLSISWTICAVSVCVCVSVTRWNMSLSATQRTRKKCVRVSVVSIAVFQVSSTNHAAATCRKPSNMVLNFLVVAMMGMSCAQQLFSNRPVKPACPWAAHLGAGGRRKPASCVQDSTNTKEGATSDSQGT